MEKYIVSYKGLEIGVLEVNEKGQHRYTPNIKNLKTVKKDVGIIYELFEPSGWRDPIPFFHNRIQDAKRFDPKSRY